MLKEQRSAGFIRSVMELPEQKFVKEKEVFQKLDELGDLFFLPREAAQFTSIEDPINVAVNCFIRSLWPSITHFRKIEKAYEEANLRAEIESHEQGFDYPLIAMANKASRFFREKSFVAVRKNFSGMNLDSAGFAELVDSAAQGCSVAYSAAAFEVGRQTVAENPNIPLLNLYRMGMISFSFPESTTSHLGALSLNFPVIVGRDELKVLSWTYNVDLHGHRNDTSIRDWGKTADSPVK